MNVIFSWLICFTNIDINFKCKEGIKHNEHIFVMVIIFECNIQNFGPTIYRHEPIDHDDYIDVLFFGSKTPLHMNMMIFFVYWA